MTTPQTIASRARRRARTLGALALALGCGASWADAQEAEPSPPAPTATTLQRVEVTGSRLPQLAGEPAAPLQIIRREQIERSGARTAEEILQQSSSFLGRYADAGGIGNTTNPGQSPVGMRTLPGANVLVLLNGRRLIQYAFGDFGVDLNAIPVAALDRVEILKDGASAIYGSDAQTGVINFITRRDFRGGVLDASGGTTQRGGASSARLTLTLGAGALETDGYNAFVVIDRQHTEALRASDRAFSASGYRPQDNIDRTSSNTFPANIVTPNGLVNPAAPGCTPPSTVPKGRACWSDPSARVDLTQPSENWSLVGRGTLRLGAKREAYAELLLARHRSDDRTDAIAVNALSTVDGSPLILPASSPFYPQGLGLSGDLTLRYRTVPLGPRVLRTTGDTGRALIGLSGEAAGWDYDSAIGHVTSRGRQQFHRGYPDSAQLVAAFATGSVNPFGDSGPVGDALLAGTEQRGEGRRARSAATWVDVRASRELARWETGPLSLAAGAEARRETLDDAPTELAGRVIAGGAGPASRGARNSQAVYAELGVPLTTNLESQFALRADHYGGAAGTSVNPKLTLRWQALPSLLLRGSAGTAFLAPSLPQLHTATTSDTITLAQVPDPIRCPVTQTPADCRPEVLLVTGGNPELKPQRTRQTSIGFVLEPARGVLASVDLWRVRLRDGIMWLYPVDLLSSGRYEGSPRIVRGPVDPATPDLPGPLREIVLAPANVGNTVISGADVELRWRSDARPYGRFSAGLNGTYMIRGVYDGVDNLIGNSDGNVSIPRWQHHLTVGWEFGPWAATLGQLYRRGYTDARPDAQNQPRRVAAYVVWDAQLAYRDLKTAWGTVKLALGAKNVFDRDPPFSNQAAYWQSGYDAFYADPRGRFWYASGSLQWR